MRIFKIVNSKLFYRYSEEDAFIQSFSKFLFYLSAFFFIMMTVLFFINLKKLGFISSFATSGTSCISASIAMFLIVRGKVRQAGILLVILQTLIILLGGYMRSPEMALITVAFFCFPTVLLAVVFSDMWVHITALLVLISALITNMLRFNISAVEVSPEILNDMLIRGTVISIATLLLIYTISIITIRSLNITLSMSRDETKKSNEKNTHIIELIDMIRKSYNELNDAIIITDRAVLSIFSNIQTEAATIEELVASIEEISSTTTSVEQATSDQNQSVNELSESIQSLSEIIDSLLQFGTELQKEFISITRISNEGKTSSSELNEVNKKTLMNSENMQIIAEIIDNFFEKINLLSLNASIEAARAGEHGRGFAVVADEIGKLADNSSSELKKIKDLIETGKSDVNFSNSIIEKIIMFIQTLDASINSVQAKAVNTMKIISSQKNIQGDMILRNKNVFEKSDFIKSASSEQAIAIQEIAKSIENTNSLVQENTKSAESLSTSYDRLKSIADELKIIMEDKKRF
ncbi:MAG TPA: methyl-accepting chemotaxis protein [Spirochaetota bacterium]|nr:methyl-accepting chemotaxis protein [Spirochaetota bacterium]HPJ34160.1 methyl-accepting chemotaxis protein [Spirochaetota bacterium]